MKFDTHRFKQLLDGDPEYIWNYAEMARELGVTGVTVKRWVLAQGVGHRFKSLQPKPKAQYTKSGRTIRELADETGFSTATVSLALRFSSEVKPETAERIRAKANELGYQSHPYVRAHMAAIRKGKPARLKEALGFLCYGSGDSGSGSKRRVQLMQESAREVGFLVKVFDLEDKQWNPGRLRRHLLDTGIRGLILDLPASRTRFYDFPYQDFQVVGFREVPGYTLPLILSNSYQNLLLAFAHAWDRGYRRICRVGFYHRSLESLFEGNAAFLLAQEHLSLPEDRIPILEMETLTDLLDGWVNTGTWEERTHSVQVLTGCAINHGIYNREKGKSTTGRL